MTTHEEALRQLTQTALSCYSADDYEHSLIQSHHNKIQELVDRATLKKVTQFEYEGDLYYWCYKCNHVEKILQIDFLNFCPNCGQALDLSDEEVA